MNFIFEQINNKEFIKILNSDDIIYLTNNELKLPIHKIIAFKSEFIKTMTKSKLINSNEIYLKINNENLKNLLKYFYFNKLTINIKNLREFFNVSQYLMLFNLQEKIEEFISEYDFNLENFEELYHIYNKYGHLLEEKNQNKFNNYFKNNLKSYLLSDLITDFSIFENQLENLDFNDILKILNNIISLEININTNFIKKIINTNKWKFLSKNDFWNDFLPFLEKMEINIESLPNLNKNLNFINKFDGHLKNYNDFQKYQNILDLKEGDYLDVLNNKTKWKLAKIVKKIGKNIKISYRGCDDSEIINLETDMKRIDILYNKSVNFMNLPINTYIEYKSENKWNIYKIIENNKNFIGLKQLNSDILVKINHNNLNLAINPTHINRIIIYSSTTILTDINWDIVPYDCLVSNNT